MSKSPFFSSAVSEQRALRQAAQREGGVTLRVAVLSLGLALLFGLIIPIVNTKMSNTPLGAQHLPIGAVGALLLALLLVNPLLRLVSRRLPFSRNEVLTVYSTCLFSCLVPGRGSENYFVANSIGAFYYATRENKWLEVLQPYLKPWLSPALGADGSYGAQGQQIAQNWYMGIQANQPIPWGAWLVPIATWSALILTTYFMWSCLAVMLRAQWAEREALAFPLLQWPLEMTRDIEKSAVPPFFLNPMMWIGFGVSALISALNGLHLYFPDVPPIPLSLDTSSLFTEAPWNQIGWFPINIYPIAVGISFLLTSEVSFSLWFFYLLFKFQYIAAYSLGFAPASLPTSIGWAGIAPPTFTGYQQMGAYLVYVFSLLWTAREHLRHIARRAFGRTPATSAERDEALGYPVAFWGFLVSFAILIVWSVAAGIRFDIALAMWSFYIICALALTRVVVETGLIYVQQGFTPLGTFAQLFGSGPGAWLSQSSLVPAGFVQLNMMIDLRANLLPSFMHSFKLAQDRRIPLKPLLTLIFATIIVAYGAGVWQMVHLGYQSGGIAFNGWVVTGSPRAAASISQQLGQGVPGSALANWFWMAFGALLTYGVMAARASFSWFPLHPIGLLLCLTHPMFMLWFSIFIGWTSKTLIMRFGGTAAYKQALPLFLGFALGDIVLMLLWLVIDGWQGRVGHNLLF